MKIVYRALFKKGGFTFYSRHLQLGQTAGGGKGGDGSRNMSSRVFSLPEDASAEPQRGRADCQAEGGCYLLLYSS